MQIIHSQLAKNLDLAWFYLHVGLFYSLYLSIFGGFKNHVG